MWSAEQVLSEKKVPVRPVCRGDLLSIALLFQSAEGSRILIIY